MSREDRDRDSICIRRIQYTVKSRKAPYANTTKDPDSTIADINRLLREYGITNYQWTTLYSDRNVTLKFAIPKEPGKNIMVKVIPPAFVQRRRTWNEKAGKYEKLELPNWSQSFRLMWWWLKVKLEAVAYGLREVEEEFLSDIVIRLPSGEESTVGEMIRPRLTSGQGDVSEIAALPEKQED